MDGQRLIPVIRWTDAAGSHTEYRKENDDYTRIIQTGPQLVAQGRLPAFVAFGSGSKSSAAFGNLVHEVLQTAVSRLESESG